MAAHSDPPHPPGMSGRTTSAPKAATVLIPGLNPPATPRMRPALRLAVEEIAYKGQTQRGAALRVGMNETSLSRALQKPHIAAYVEYLKAQAVLDAATLKDQARTMAIRVGIQLLHDAKSEAVKARMVEFFAGEPRGPSVAVQVNVPQAQGYAYTRPDSASGAGSAQVIDAKANNDAV